MPMNWLRALATARISSSSLACMAAASRFWLFWIRKTIRKVMIVVAVFTTSCQVSEKPKIGPVAPQIRIRLTAAMNVAGWPAAIAIRDAMRVKIRSIGHPVFRNGAGTHGPGLGCARPRQHLVCDERVAAPLVREGAHRSVAGHEGGV